MGSHHPCRLQIICAARAMPPKIIMTFELEDIKESNQDRDCLIKEFNANMAEFNRNQHLL
jgi:hypothetical protein